MHNSGDEFDFHVNIKVSQYRLGSVSRRRVESHERLYLSPMYTWNYARDMFVSYICAEV